jgi:hypothetical protein
VADVERKWIDNFLSRVDVAGAESSGHGVVRRLTIGAIRQIALTRELIRDFGLTLERAASLAGALLANGGEVRGPSGLTIRLDIAAFGADIDRRVADGVEAVVLARRGRPPSSRGGRR